MTTYREIVGKKIKKVTSDPSTGIDGQMWYNSTTGNLRGLAVTEAWASSSSLNTGRGAMGHGSASQTAGLVFGGFLGPSTYYTKTEEYNGTNFSVGGELPANRGWIQGAGTQTAAIGIGGSDPGGSAQTNVYNYNGTSWSSNPHSLPTGVYEGGSAGTSTSAIIYAGRPPSPFSSASYEYDGSSWTSGGTMGTGRRLPGGGGTQTSCRASGGVLEPSTVYTANSEEYNGTSWSEGPNLNTARRDLAGSGANADAQRVSGGAGPAAFSTKSEAYNGTSWSEGPDLATGKQDSSPSMNASSNLTFMTGGYTSADTAPGATEEFTQSTNVITAAAWSSGGPLNTARRGSCSGGDKTAAYYAGGIESGASAKTETYDGTSFSEVNDMGTARYGIDTNIGTLTAGLTAGGRGGGTVYGNTEEWDGTNWSEQTNMSSARRYLGGFGTQTAGVIFGGRTAPNAKVATTEEYNGSSWTSGGDMNTVREYAAGCGILTAGLTLAGAPGAITDVEYYNGTAWSEQSAAFPGQNSLFGISGTQTNALIFGGDGTGSSIASAFVYDGTTFATSPSLGTARQAMGSPGPSGTSTSAIAIAGYTSTNVGTTEEFTGETETANIENFTTS